MKTEDKIEVLMQCSPVSSASEEDLALLAEAATPVSFAAGELVFDVGDESNEVYVVAAGALRARLSKDGNLISVFQSGALFGEYAMFSGGVRAARVTAAEPSVALEIDAGAFRDFLLRSPATTLDLLQTAVRRLSRAERPQNKA